MTTNIVFVGGYYRSGTSMMRAILGSHPEIAFIPYDLPLWTELYERWQDAPLHLSEVRRDAAYAIARHPKYAKGDVRVDADELASVFEQSKETRFEKLVACFLKEHRSISGRTIVGHKCPRNELYFPVIREHISECRFVHMVRDPRSIAASYVNKDGFGDLDIQKFYEVWKQSVSDGIRWQKEFPASYKLVSYEAFVANPKEQLKDITDFLGVDYDEQMLRMGNHPNWSGQNTSFRSAEQRSLGTSRVSTSAVARHKWLSTAESYLFQLLFSEEMRLFGYPPIAGVGLNDRVAAIGQFAKIRLLCRLETAKTVLVHYLPRARNIDILTGLKSMLWRWLKVVKPKATPR